MARLGFHLKDYFVDISTHGHVDICDYSTGKELASYNAPFIEDGLLPDGWKEEAWWGSDMPSQLFIVHDNNVYVAQDAARKFASLALQHYESQNQRYRTQKDDLQRNNTVCVCKAADHDCLLEYENDSIDMFGGRNEEYGCRICDHGDSKPIKKV